MMLSLKPSDIDKELLQDFKLECLEYLNSFKSILADLRKDPNNLEVLNYLFSAIHSIKGGAHYLGLLYMGELSSSIEKVVVKLRNKELKNNDDILNVFDESISFLKLLYLEIDDFGWEKTPAKILVQKINNQWLEKNKDNVEQSKKEEKISHRPEDIDLELLDDFKEETSEHLESVESFLLELEKNPEKYKLIDDIFGPIHSIKGGAEYLGLLYMGKLTHHLENLLAKLKKNELSVSEDIVDILLQGLDFINRLFDEIVDTGWEKSSPLELITKIGDITGDSVEEKIANTNIENITNGNIEKKSSSNSNVQFPELFEIFFTDYNALVEKINDLFDKLKETPNDKDASKELAKLFSILSEKSQKLGFTKISEISEFVEKICIGLAEEKIQNELYALRTIFETIELFDVLISEIAEFGKEKIDIRTLVDNFTKINFSGDVYDPAEEFKQEVSLCINEIKEAIAILSAKGYQKYLCEEIIMMFTSIRGCCQRLHYKELVNLVQVTENISNMILHGELEFYPRIQNKFIQIVNLIETSIDKQDLEKISTITKELVKIIETRQKCLQKNIQKVVTEKTEIAIEDFYQALEVLNKKNSLENIVAIKKIAESFSLFLIDKDLEYYWDITQFILEYTDKIEEKGECTTSNIKVLFEIVIEIEELIILKQKSTSASYKKHDRFSVEERLILFARLRKEQIKHLLKHYQSEIDFKKATVEELSQIESITPIIAKRIHEEFVEIYTEVELESIKFKKNLMDVLHEKKIIDLDYDNELLDIFTKNAIIILEKIHHCLCFQINISASKYWQQVILLLKSLRLSAKYMEFQNLTDVISSLINDLQNEVTIDSSKIDHVQNQLLEICKNIPYSQKKELVLPENAEIQNDASENSNKSENKPSQEHQDEMIQIFIPSVQDDIQRLKETLPNIIVGIPDIPQMQQTVEILSNIITMASEINFENLVFVLMREKNELQEVIQGEILTNEHVQNLTKIISSLEDFVLELSGEEVEPEMPKQILQQLEKDVTDYNQDMISEETSSSSINNVISTEAKLTKQEIAQEMQTGQTLRVKNSKIDDLMGVVGELAINKTSFDLLNLNFLNFYQSISSLLSAEQEKLFKNLVQNINIESSEYGRIVNRLQENVMQIRMVPIKSLFRRFPRVVRETAKKMGKMVKLDIYGEDTELDRTIIEQLSSPIIHILRNMIDHGVEDSKSRIKNGKTPYGQIEIHAYHEGNQVIIELADDGKGVDVEAIRKKVEEKKIAMPEIINSMSESELLDMLYLPGFSMKKEVSTTSGRGMGMSVVKSSLIKIGGTIEMDTKLDSYTCFMIKIPLTLAIIKALLIKSCGETYCVPISSIREVIELEEQDIHLSLNQEILNFRNESLPLVHLSKLFNLPKQQKARFIAVIHSGMGKVALLVDHLIGEQDIVIKNIKDELIMTNGISGATFLGNGQISLILDVSEIIALRSK